MTGFEGVLLYTKTGALVLLTTVDENGTLDFEMETNQGVKTVEDLKEITDAGYVVKFLASANKLKNDADTGSATNTNTTGVVSATAKDKFDYQVVVEKDGEKVAESERVTVEVKKFDETVTEISAIELYVTQGTDTDVKVESGKLVNTEAAGDTAKVKVIGRTANMKADEKDALITDKVELSTDKVAIISAIDKTTGGITFGGALGNVTITAKAGDITKAITVDVVDEARKVSAENSTIAVDAIEIAAGKPSDKIRVELKDQYGDAFVGKVTATNDENVAVLSSATATQAEDKDGKDIVGAYDVVLTAGAEADKGNVVVKVGETGSEVELGKIYVTVKEAGDVADYKLETVDGKYEIELMGATDESKKLQLTLNGYDAEGLLVGPETLDDYSFESSNEKVATVDNGTTNKGQVTAVAPGTATIKVYKTEDAFKTAVAKVEITVKDSTPAITDAKVVAPEKMTEAGAIDLAKIFTEVTAVDPEGKAVEVNDFSDKKVTVGESSVEIGSFLVTTVKAEDSNVNAAEINNGKINVTGSGKATINIALLNAKGEIVKDVNVEVDIPVTPADDGTEG